MTNESDGCEPISGAPENGGGTDNAIERPPEAIGQLSRVRCIFFWLGWIAIIVGGLLTADQLCWSTPVLPGTWSCPCWAYAGLGLVLIGVVSSRVARHKLTTQRERLDDRSEVEALIVEAQTVEPRLDGSGDEASKRPRNYKQKVDDLKKELHRLKERGWNDWTEYQVLPLKQLLVEFLNVDHLKATVRSVLDDLQEYADDPNLPRIDSDSFKDWQQRVKDAEKQIKNDASEPPDRDDSAEGLRAVLGTLYEHVANYEANWAKGSAIMQDLRVCGVSAIPILLLMSLVPSLHPAGTGLLGLLSWGLLGVVGSLTAAIVIIRRSNLVEVGNTEGRRELARTILGGALGLVAGIFAFGLIAVGLIEGPAVPKIDVPQVAHIGLSAVWGISAGFSFEKVIERTVRGMTEAIG